MERDRHPDTHARLLVPSLSLSGCLHASLWRDTTRAQGLSDAQRQSYFPASPFCGLSWTLEGEGWALGDAGELTRIEQRSLIGGPRSRPAQFRSEAGLRCFMVAFLPEALHALTGLDLAAYVDRYVPVESVLGEDWQQLSARIVAARDEQHCQQILEAFLLPRWRAHRADQGQARGAYRDWMQNLALRAVAAGHGASLRQMERRIKQLSGQSLRALRRVSRAETAFFQVRQDMAEGEVIWAALAQDAGYADQAHLCRETRRVTGFSPEELRQRIDSDEAFWAYRIWQ